MATEAQPCWYYRSDMSSFDLTNKASEAGFIGYFMFPSSLQYPMLQALALGLLCHNAMVYQSISVYVDTVWKPKWKTVLDVLESNPAYTNCIDEYFWNEVTQAMFSLTTGYMIEDKKFHISEKLKTNTPLNEADAIQMITILSLHICLKTLHLHKSEGDYLVKTYNVAKSTSFCVVIGEENGNWFYFIHRDFIKGNERRGFPFFCEANEEIEIPGFVGNKLRPEPQIGNEQFLTETLKLLVALGRFSIPPALETQLVTYKQTANLYQRTHPEFPEEAISLIREVQSLQVHSPVAPSEGLHDIAQCCEFNVTEPYKTLNCNCRTHVECLKQHIYKCFNSHSAPKFTCPKCPRELSDQELEEIDESLYAELLKRRAMRQCASCNQLRKQETMLNHCSKKSVCIDCLSTSVCPLCNRNLSEKEKTWVVNARSRLGGNSFQ